MTRPIRMFWSGGRTNWVNYGDLIGPVLVELLSGRDVVYAGISSCELLSVGSILERYARHKWRRVASLNLAPLSIWGSGSINGNRSHSLGRVRIVSVRGRSTIAKYGLPADTLVGDPGILAHLLLPDRPIPKATRWGVIPHLADLKDTTVRHLVDRTQVARLIDLSNPDVRSVTKQIAACEFIASSSLHGLIAADSLGIPNFRMIVSERIVGGDWKFNDYASALDNRPLISRVLGPTLDLCSMETELSFAYAAQVDQLKASVLKAFHRLVL